MIAGSTCPRVVHTSSAFVSPYVYHLSCDTMVLTIAQVLVVDLMGVPDQGISDRAQGGYLVAIVLPGIAIGAFCQWYIGWLARRAGCVVGGFCMAMWIETLCPGGVIKTSGMTALLIGVMCVVSVALSIPMLKKWAELVYMIFSAFSGSTALMLGIDCYSRAGLKEFWIYTWRMLGPDCGFPFTDLSQIFKGSSSSASEPKPTLSHMACSPRLS